MYSVLKISNKQHMFSNCFHCWLCYSAIHFLSYWNKLQVNDIVTGTIKDYKLASKETDHRVFSRQLVMGEIRYLPISLNVESCRAYISVRLFVCFSFSCLKHTSSYYKMSISSRTGNISACDTIFWWRNVLECVPLCLRRLTVKWLGKHVSREVILTGDKDAKILHKILKWTSAGHGRYLPAGARVLLWLGLAGEPAHQRLTPPSTTTRYKYARPVCG